MPKSASTSGGGGGGSSNNNEQLFPPLNYSRSYFTQWLLKDCKDIVVSEDVANMTVGSAQQQYKQNHHDTNHNKSSLKRNNMELIQLLAINALEFTAPVYSFLNKDLKPPSPTTQPSSSSSSSAVVLKDATPTTAAEVQHKNSLTKKTSTELMKLNREFIQLSGHPGSFAPAGPNSIWKKMPNDSNNEAMIYEKLQKTEDPFKKLIPSYISRTDWNQSTFIELEDLVTRFNLDNLNIMDIKLGTRTFLESEVTNSKPRTDLYEKMRKLDPNAFTPEENETKSITKLRYMQFREELSSTKSLGFRIEGVKLSSNLKNNKKEEVEYIKGLNLQRLRDEAEITNIFTSFCSDRKIFVKKLEEVRRILESSKFFMSHEMIGSSLLLIHDNNEFGLWIIDFAKTSPLIKTLSHRLAWKMGNREDGVLTGIDNLIRLHNFL